MDVDIREMPARRVAAVRHVGPYNQIPVAFECLHAIVAATPELQQPTSMLALYHDDPETTSKDELRSDAGVVVPEAVTLPGGLTEQRLPAGRYARALHVGPYEELGDVWARFMGEWLPASGQRVGSGPSYEVYLNTPMTAPKEQLRTELYIPLA
jgi:AraC family transcriptional regulator